MDAKTIISKLINEHGFTQVEIGLKADLSQPMVSHLYRGVRGKRVSHSLMNRLHKLLNEVDSSTTYPVKNKNFPKNESKSIHDLLDGK